MTRKDPSKADRALELSDNGIPIAAIKERLGYNTIQAALSAISVAKARRAKTGEVVA